jgi:protein-tyrosine phosphatase
MDAQRRYKLENILNCRDLGGYPSKYGYTKFGRFIRCGTVARPTDKDISMLKELNISTVIDLRGDFEFENQPNDMQRLTDNVNHISLYELNVADAKDIKVKLHEIYEHIVNNYKGGIASALKTIASSPDGAVLYHCFLGKDRTGILSLMLLTIAGVDEDDIVADYQLTFTYLESFIRSHSEALWETDMSMHYSQPETMRSLISYIKEKYGSVINYILQTGVSQSEIDTIRKKFY